MIATRSNSSEHPSSLHTSVLLYVSGIRTLAISITARPGRDLNRRPSDNQFSLQRAARGGHVREHACSLGAPEGDLWAAGGTQTEDGQQP